MANTHGFFAGRSKANINTNGSNLYSNGGYNIFCTYDIDNSTYVIPSGGTGAVINTPGVSSLGNTYDQAANNAMAGAGLITQNGGELADGISGGFMEGINGGTQPASESTHPFFFLGTIGFSLYNNLGASSAAKIDSSTNDGFRSNNEELAAYTTAGVSNVATSTDYTVCICAGDINGSSSDTSGARITFRFSNNALGAGLSKLAYYYPTDSNYGLIIEPSDSDELAAAKWLLNGYPILQNGEPVFWDNAN